MSIDLHIHTTVSDGDIDPVSVVKMAAEAGLQIIALADHETTSGFLPAYREGLVQGIKVIPAVELLSYYKGTEIHVLGYFTDPDNKLLQRELAELRHQRTRCAEESVRILREFGFDISWDDIKGLVTDEGTVSKGHIMQAINRAGYIRDSNDAVELMKKYLNRDGLAYTCHEYQFDDAVGLIKAAGGIPILAHPGLIRDDTIVQEICMKGILGIEVYYYYFGPKREQFVMHYSSLAREKGLLKTGGSDYHGTITPVTLGANRVPTEGVRDFLKEFGICQ